VLISPSEPINQSLPADDRLEQLDRLGQVGQSDTSPRRAVPNELHEGVPAVKGFANPALAEPDAKVRDGFQGCRSLVRRKVGFSHLIGDRLD